MAIPPISVPYWYLELVINRQFFGSDFANCKQLTANVESMDPEVMKYFKKIISSFSVGLLWLFAISTLGIYFQLGFADGGLHWYNWIFYIFSLVTLLLLLRFYYRLWRSKPQEL